MNLEATLLYYLLSSAFVVVSLFSVHLVEPEPLKVVVAVAAALCMLMNMALILIDIRLLFM